MKNVKIIIVVAVALAIVLAAGWFWWASRVCCTIDTPDIPVEVPEEEEEATTEHLSLDGVLMEVTSPLPESKIASPLTIVGSVTGSWYFEATFPVVLTDWDGRIIAEGYATAQDDWMTTDMVPFEAVIDFESPYGEGDPEFMQYGALILQKSNASGLPEHDDAVEFRVKFDP